MNVLSLSTWLYDRLPFDEVVRRVKHCGYENIELSGWNWVHDVWKVEEVARICEKEKVNVLSVHCNHHALHDKDFWTTERYEAYHDQLYRSLQIFGHPIIVEHGLYENSVHAPRQKEYDRICVELAQKYGIRLTVENVPTTTYKTPEDMRRVLRPDIRFTFDVAHAAYMDIDPLDFEGLFPYMVNAHMYDVVSNVSLSDWAPVDTGLGKINWKRYIDALKKSGYGGPCTVELTEDNFVKVLNVYAKVVSPNVVLDVADQCAIYSRERLEDLL